MNIDEMQAGPELDELVAEHVMGWTIYVDFEPRFWLTDGESNGWAVDDFDAEEVTRTGVTEIVTHHGVFRPSVDWGAAGVVFDRMPHLRECWKKTMMLNQKAPGFIETGVEAIVWGSTTERWSALAETAQLAICRAALKAVLGIDKT